MNNFISEIDGFYNNNICYSDCDSLYIEKRYWDALDKANLVSKIYAEVKMISKLVVSFAVDF